MEKLDLTENNLYYFWATYKSSMAKGAREEEAFNEARKYISLLGENVIEGVIEYFAVLGRQIFSEEMMRELEKKKREDIIKEFDFGE